MRDQDQLLVDPREEARGGVGLEVPDCLGLCRLYGEEAELALALREHGRDGIAQGLVEWYGEHPEEEEGMREEGRRAVADAGRRNLECQRERREEVRTQETYTGMLVCHALTCLCPYLLTTKRPIYTSSRHQ